MLSCSHTLMWLIKSDSIITIMGKIWLEVDKIKLKRFSGICAKTIEIFYNTLQTKQNRKVYRNKYKLKRNNENTQR